MLVSATEDTLQANRGNLALLFHDLAQTPEQEEPR